MINKIITNAITTVLALGLGSSAAIAANNEDQAKNIGDIQGMEKCYGIAKAGRNDCATKNHGCAGEEKIDRNKQAWINVPTGICQKIVGGQTKPSET